MCERVSVSVSDGVVDEAMEALRGAFDELMSAAQHASNVANEARKVGIDVEVGLREVNWQGKAQIEIRGVLLVDGDLVVVGKDREVV